MMNYESEFADVLEDALSKRFGLERNSYLFLYLLLRYEVWRFQKKEDPLLHPARHFLSFLQDELHLPITKEGLQYKEERLCLYFSAENSLLNIIENWKFQYKKIKIKDEKGTLHDFPQLFSKMKKSLFKKAKSEAKPFKSSPYYDWIVRHFALQIINRDFQVTLSAPIKIPHVNYESSELLYLRTLEEQCEAYFHSVTFQRNDTKTISESDLEDFLASRLHLIEEGLRLVGRQHIIEDGRIDILARDKENHLVIIELKVQDDKTIVWQCLYYPEALKKEFHTERIRMITVTPSYPTSIQLALEQIPYVEMIEYTPDIQLGVIQGLEIRKKSNKKMMLFQ